MLADVTVHAPGTYMGDLIGDINRRRGEILNAELDKGRCVIHAYIPLAELFGYATDLRSRTQGRAAHSPMQLSAYHEVPAQISKEIVARVRGE